MVLGLGNILNRDKGLGIYAIRDLHKEGWPEEIKFRNSVNFDYEAFSLQGYDSLLVLNILEFGKHPGTLYRLTNEDLIRNKQYLQEPILWKVLTVNELLGNDLQVVLMGIEPENLNWELSLSPTLQGIYSFYLQSVRDELYDFIRGLEKDKAYKVPVY